MVTAMFRTVRRCCGCNSGAVLLAAALLAVPALARAVPSLMNYQGLLTKLKQPMTGTLPMEFAIYSDSTGGQPLWTESYGGIAVAAGAFNVLLGSVTPLPPAVFSGPVRWIQTSVNGSVILPRRPIVTTA